MGTDLCHKIDVFYRNHICVCLHLELTVIPVFIWFTPVVHLPLFYPGELSEADDPVTSAGQGLLQQAGDRPPQQASLSGGEGHYNQRTARAG